MQPTRHQFTVLKQTCDLVPSHLVSILAKEHGEEDQSRNFTPWSHLVSLTFITNNFDWSAGSVCDLHKGRRGIEVFFKQIKPTLQLGDVIGHNANAVRWQIWTALLTYVLLRFIAYMGKWRHSFARLFTVLRGTLWECFDLFKLLERYGTASPPRRFRAAPKQACLPGLNLC